MTEEEKRIFALPFAERSRISMLNVAKRLYGERAGR